MKLWLQAEMCRCDFCVQKCSASVGLYLHLCENSLPRDSLNNIACFSLCSAPVFQDSGIPDSFPIYHYNGLKQSNHNERVRHSFIFRFFIAADGGGYFSYSICLSVYYFSSFPVIIQTHSWRQPATPK